MMLSAFMMGNTATPVVDLGYVEYVGSNFGSYTSSGTTSSATIPAGTLLGDMMIAMVLHRSALTAPAGWSVLQSLSVTGGKHHSIYDRFIKDSRRFRSFFNAHYDSIGKLKNAYICLRG